ncbi:MAG: FAD binding domain-containing protein, partial [Candidatus Binatia bacterium]
MIMIPAFAYTRARDLAEALTLVAQPGASPVAGGTDLLGCLRDGAMEANHLVSLARLDVLRGVAETGDGSLRLGALTPLSEIARHAAVTTRYPGLAQAAAAVASPQLRNQGTLGGNLCQRPRCWFYRGGYDCARKGGDVCYAMQGDNRYHAIFGGSTCFIVHPSDTAVALTALGAGVGIAGPKGARQVPIDTFFVGPDEDMRHENVLAAGELVTDVVVPALAAGTRSVFRKVRARGTWDFALA